MLADIVPEVAVEDLEGVIAFAIERNLISWEQVAMAERLSPEGAAISITCMSHVGSAEVGI